MKIVWAAAFAACMAATARVKALNAQLHCQEGDMSCNLPMK
jgi:hypothetical protein